ncbi:uncharacterized protein LOC117790540 [Drosophila innubila]|uniref:uncharacterized protein LOC117790540 n=1 Tax=Drosophila innubila TaxID=198719 RepID=UPI00148CA90F|nr:uncharacterized protein LOC117790540 [Drosophila innubila]
MRLKEYPEIMLDTIPKLYEIHSKVFITNLYGMEEQVERLPKRFCKMYTTQPLANQLWIYLNRRNANISMQDFHIVEESQPFAIRLSDGKRLEVMLCAGNELGSSLMLLIRRQHGGRLLYYYSAVQQDDLSRLMGNETYQKWISLGTEVLFLNLQAANQPFVHIDFEGVAAEISKYCKDTGNEDVIKVPLFGYEYLVHRLAKTFTLFGHIELQDSFMCNFCCLTLDTRYFHRPGYTCTVKICNTNNFPGMEHYPLSKLKWTPVPNRINLIQLCSLLRPLHISGIVGYHEMGNVGPVPAYLKRFKKGYSPKSHGIEIPETQLTHEHSNDNAPAGYSNTQSEKISPAKSPKDGTNSRRDPFVFTKPRKLAFVEYEDDRD